MPTDRIVYTRRTVTTTPPDEHPGVRLRRAREWRGLTQLQLAQSAEVNEQTVWRAEKHGSVSNKAVSGFARVLRVQPDWLLYGYGPSPEEAELIEEYLLTELGQSTPPPVAKLLRRVSFVSLGLRHVSMQGVHRVRELIQMNRLLGTTMGHGFDAAPKPPPTRR